MGTQPLYRDQLNKEQVRTIIQTTRQIFIGTLHIQSGFRIKDVINRPEEDFIAVSDVEFLDQGEKYRFLLLQKKEIVWLSPVEATGSQGDFIALDD